MTCNYQDWNPVILKSGISKNNVQKNNTKTTSVKTTEKKYGAGKNSQHASVNGAKIERNLEDEEKLEIPKVSKEFQTQMMQARLQKGLTQKQLANACNLTEHTIKNYENGKAIPQSNDIVKINKILGVTLKK